MIVNQQTVKYIFAAVLFIIALIINGEIFILHTDNFQEAYYQADFAFSESQEPEVNRSTLDDVMACGKKMM